MITRLVRSVVSGLLLLLILAGLPTALVMVQRAAQWDWPQLAVDPLSDVGALLAVVAAGWLLWLALLLMVVLDAADAVRHAGREPRLPVPLHAAVTALVSGVLLAVEAARGGSTAGPADRHAPAPTVAPAPLAAPETRDAPGTGAADAARTASSSPSDSGSGSASGSALTVAGVDVPGGWLPVPVAAAVAGAAALVWAHRRRRYLPRPPHGWRRADDDLTPLPATVTRVGRLARAATGTGASEASPPAGEAVAEDLGRDLGQDVDDLVPDGPVAWPVGAVLPAAGVALVGPGAYDAARGLLVAVTVAQATQAAVLVSARLWSELIGVDAVAGSSGRVRVVEDNGHWPGPPASSGPAAAMTVVLADATTTSVPIALTRLRAGAPAAVRIVVIGAAAGGNTWHVAGDGRLHPVTGSAPVTDRLPVLNLATARTLTGALGIVTSAAGTLDAPVAGHAPASARQDTRRTVPAAWAAGTSHNCPADPPGGGHPAVADVPDWPDPLPEEAGQPRRLLVRVLGAPEVLLPHPDGSHSTVRIRRSAGQQILVLLTVHRDGLSAADLKEAIWPDVPSSAAHRRFHTTVSELRRTLRDAANAAVLVQRQRTGGDSGDPAGVWYRLDPSAVQVDLWRLQAVLDAAAATSDPARRRRLLSDAAGLCSLDQAGDLAEGWDLEWLAAAREHVARHLIDVLTHLADLEPDQPTAVQLLRQALRVSPTNEAVHRRLMDLHRAAGDSAALHRAAATYTEHLTLQHLTPQHLAEQHLAEQHDIEDPAAGQPLETPGPSQTAWLGPSASTRTSHAPR